MSKRVTDFTALSAGDVSGTELLYVIDAGLSPADRKMTLSVLQTWLATQNWSFSGSIALTGALTLTGLTVTTNGIAITGNSTIAGTLSGISTLSATTFSGTLSGAAPAGWLSGTTLASNVVTSSLTAIGTLASGAVPASLVTAGTFGSGSFTFPGALAITGALTGVTTLTTSGAINGQTISSAASLTGTLAVAGVTTLSARVNLTQADNNYYLMLSDTGGGNNEYLSFYGNGSSWVISSNKNGSGVRRSIGIGLSGDDVTVTNNELVLTSGAATINGTLAVTGQLSTAVGYQFRGTSGTSYELLRCVGATNNPGLFLSVNESTNDVELTASGSNVTGQLLRLGAQAVVGLLDISGTGVAMSGTLAVGTSTLGDSFSVFQFPGTSVGLTLRDSLDTSGAYFQAFRNSAGTIIGSVNRVSTTNAVIYNTTSDYRQKNNLRALTGSGEFIDALKPKTWEWESDGSIGNGFVAHEFALVSPSSVSGTKDAVDADGNPIYQGMQASTSEVIANIVAELQSLRARIAQYE